MNKNFRLLGYYNYTVILTYIGMITGFSGIVSMFENNAVRAVICLMIAGICDMFDGTIASTRKRNGAEKCFGIQIDSLSDLICFGVLPAVITVGLNRSSKLAFAISALYALCALIRLAYFNVDEQERQKKTEKSREIYYGMPVTLSSLFIPLLFFTAEALKQKTALILLIALIIMAALFLIPFPVKKPHIQIIPGRKGYMENNEHRLSL